MSMDRPNHSGVCVGKVKSVQGISASIQLTEDVNAQDVLEFREKDRPLYDFTVKNETKKGMILTTNFMKGSGIQPGNLVYRTKNNSLLDLLNETYMKQEIKEKIDGYFEARKGEPVRFTLVKGKHSAELTGDIVDAAMNQPTTVDKIEKQLRKMNDTPYSFEHLEIYADEDVFLPVGKLNEIRRNAVAALTEVITSSYRREEPVPFHLAHVEEEADGATPQITVGIHDLSQLSVVLEYEKCHNIYLDINCVDFKQLETVVVQIHESGKKVYLVMPHIFRREARDLFNKHKKELIAANLDGFVVKSLEEFVFLKELLTNAGCYEEKELITDYNVYVMNKEAKAFWREQGIKHYTSPLELNQMELMNLGCEGSDLFVYGRIPLMISAQCVIKNVGKFCEMGNRVIGDVSKEYPDGTKRFEMIDRCQKSFFVRNHCKFCYNTIYNGDCISLLDQVEEVLKLNPKTVRIDFTFETEEEIQNVMEAYIRAYVDMDFSRIAEKEGKNLTRGHFKRGII